MKSTVLALRPHARTRGAFDHLARVGTAALLAAALGTATSVALAQQPAAPAQAAPAATAMTNGIVRSVDRKAGTITIKHEHIANIGMAPMTMVFKAAKPALLDGVQKDDKIRFHAEEPGGVLTVTAIEVLRAK